MDISNNDNSDDEYEDEELLVYLDFQKLIKSESLDEPNLKIKMIGFETDQPVVQINNKIFRGTFENAMGTNVFFAENPNPPPMDPNFETIPPTMYKYCLQTDKVLKMERIFITPKTDDEKPEDDLSETHCDEDVVPTESYSDALNQFLGPTETPPRTLSGSDVLKPIEFQSFFRPQLNQIDDEQSETNEKGNKSEENYEESESMATATVTDLTDVNVKEVKIETIKQEKQ